MKSGRSEVVTTGLPESRVLLTGKCSPGLVKLLRVLPILSTNIEEIIFHAHVNFHEPNKFLQSSTIIINYRVIVLEHILIIQLNRIIIVFQIKYSWRNALRQQTWK